LIACAGNIKHQTALSVAYGTGLRVNEVISLKVSDIDSQRMTLRVEQGKGSKDRYAMLSPVLLERLRVWWRVARAQGKMLDGGWLFPGRDPIDPLTARQLNRAIHEAAMVAKIDKPVSMHTLRHSFATHLRAAMRLGMPLSQGCRPRPKTAARWCIAHSRCNRPNAATARSAWSRGLTWRSHWHCTSSHSAERGTDSRLGVVVRA
jgi:integrase